MRAVLILAAVVVSSCTCEKRIIRLANRCDLPRDTITNIAYIDRDTVIYDSIQGDTVFAEVLVDCSDLANIKPVTARTELAEATATFEDGKINLRLIQHQTIRPIPIQMPIIIYKDQITQTVIKEVIVEPKRWDLYRIGFWIFGIIILLGIIIATIIIVISIKK